MKRIKTISVTILLIVMTGCVSKQSTDDLIIVDVTKSYPKKELILQDLLDVEYIPLETTDESVTGGYVMDIGKEYILVRNNQGDGDIFIFDNAGKYVRKFNRKGNGPSEYLGAITVLLDEDNEEIYVDDSSRKSIKVYDLYGNFKREFNYLDGASYGRMQNYDSQFLICWDSRYANSTLFQNEPDARRSDDNILKSDTTVATFFIVSKLDGSIAKEITFSFTESKSYSGLIINRDNQGVMQEIRVISSANAISIINSRNHWLLAEPSVDTIYRYLPDNKMIPFMARTPSIQSMDPEVFLLPGIITDRYYFMQIYKKEYDHAKRRTVPSIDLLFDRQEKALYEYIMYNDDYSDKRNISMMGKSGSENDKIAFWQTIDAYQLVEDYKNGLLKGKLKEIAATLDEEDNQVIMLVKHKKQ
jgi:hypothetical protein